MPVMMTHDTSIGYDVYGDDPPLILINGLGFGRWGWFKQVPALSRHFRIITFDIRGQHSLAHSVTDLSAEVVALLDHLGIEKTHVPGTSLGGFVAQKLALDRPDLVDRLVLVCTSYGGVGRKPMSFEALGRMLGWGSLRPEDAMRRGLETANSDAYRAGNPDEFDRILHWRLADSPSLSEYSQQMMAGAQFDASRNVAEISSPTLVVHGAEDRYVPLPNAVALAESIPNTKLRVLDGSGHLVFIEQAKEVNKEIIAFLKPRKKWRHRIRPAKQKTEARRAALRGQHQALSLSQAPQNWKETELPEVVGEAGDEEVTEGRRDAQAAGSPRAVAKDKGRPRFWQDRGLAPALVSGSR